MNPVSYDFAPLAQLLFVAAGVALAAVFWLWSRQRRRTPRQWLAALTLLTLFLTFDLVVFGAFTRLSDSGLGCPDWPGCYGHTSPVGASDSIETAQLAMPTGPVTHGKAWVEMVHRYLAGGVGALCVVLCALSWWWRRHGISPWWATLSLAWVVVQGVFGALTVTMKLFPAIVTLHLLFALLLVVQLAWQAEAYVPRPLAQRAPGLLGAAAVAFALVLLQAALGGWVSTNYAVLACNDFPACQAGQWWPPTDFDHAFTFLRPLGQDGAGGLLSFSGLVAIHLVHRCAAVVVTLAVLGLSAWLAWAGARRWALRLLGVLAWQLASGVCTVVFGWPLAAALAHTAGAAMLLLLLSVLIARLSSS